MLIFKILFHLMHQNRSYMCLWTREAYHTHSNMKLLEIDKNVLKQTQMNRSYAL